MTFPHNIICLLCIDGLSRILFLTMALDVSFLNKILKHPCPLVYYNSATTFEIFCILISVASSTGKEDYGGWLF